MAKECPPMRKFHPFLAGLLGGCAILWLAPWAAAAAAVAVQAVFHAFKEYLPFPGLLLSFLVSCLPELLVVLLVACVVLRREASPGAALLGMAAPLLVSAMITCYLLFDGPGAVAAAFSNGFLWASIANAAVGLGVALLVTRP